VVTVTDDAGNQIVYQGNDVDIFQGYLTEAFKLSMSNYRKAILQ